VTLLSATVNASTCVADSAVTMSGPLVANAYPFVLHSDDFGTFQISGAIGGLASLQDNPSADDMRAVADLDNGLLFVQQTDTWVQAFAALGAYSLPSLGTAYLNMGRTAGKTYGYIPEAFVKLAFSGGLAIEAGKLPSPIGEESLFSFENVDIERGLLWNQTPSISRGLQVNYAGGPVSLSLSWNDGFYSNRFNWIAGSVSYTLEGSAGAIALVGGANLGHTAYADFATPLAQNNSAILDIGYSVVRGSWTIDPYIQLSKISEDHAGKVADSGYTEGAAMLAIRKLNEEWSVGVRGEYLGSQGRENLLYGPGSAAWSITVTPTYQKGVFFARAEASYVVLSHAQPGSELGRKAEDDSQARLMFEAGILF